MKVRELIAELQKFDPELPIYSHGGGEAEAAFGTVSDPQPAVIDLFEGPRGVTIFDQEYLPSPLQGIPEPPKFQGVIL